MKKKDNLGFLNIDTSLYKTRINSKYANKIHYKPANPFIILSYIPGTVLDILVKVGQKVNKGDNLMILDAMKMQNNLRCNIKGKVKKVLVNKGDKVSKGTALLELE